MARQTAAVEINKFNAGLITDASPLTAPDNASLEEENFVLNTDGSRNRRLGMDYEQDHIEVHTTIDVSLADSPAHTVFKWTNAGGVAGRNISVVQFGNEIKFFDLNIRPISRNLLHTSTFSAVPITSQFSFASVDGFLVVTTGEGVVRVFEVNGDTITSEEDRLLVRDLFGVEDVYNFTDLYSPEGLQLRPPVLTEAHRYNLRNQSWGVPRAETTPAATVSDPIGVFLSFAQVYPSNSDTVNEALYADPAITPDRTLERFFANDLYKNPIGSTKAAQGYFIIDALNRGASRISAYFSNWATYPVLAFPLSTLPEDRTPGGATVVGEYAGRSWFGGFSGDVVDGDSLSPRMSSYILFSQLVRSPKDIFKCFQEGDPTSRLTPDIIDTDGGFIRINEAFGINRLINLGDALIVMAVNGVWSVSGTTDNGFTATNFRITKVSDRGCINPNSAVVVDNTVFYWSEDGIYHLKSNEFGQLSSGSISVDKIQKLFEGISEDDKTRIVGSYDKFQRKIKWVYDTNINNNRQTKELILDIILQAFYINAIKSTTTGFPRVVSVFEAVPYEIDTFLDFVTSGGEEVVVNDNEVYITTNIKRDVERGELAYIVVTGLTPFLSYTFCNYTDPSFRDWRSRDGVGIDAEAYMVTSHLSGTDFQRDKQVPYITTHLRRTEVGIDENGEYIQPSSCLVQARWDWSDSGASNKWSRPFQAYRYRRPYVPESLPDDLDTGLATVVRRNRVRGNGKVVSFKFSTEPDKDCHLYGWSMIFSVANSV